MVTACLFRSVAVGLIHRLHHGDKDIEQVLLGLGVSHVSLNDVEYLQRLLRTLMVKEWQEHTDHYQGYLTEDLAPHIVTEWPLYRGFRRLNDLNTCKCLAHPYNCFHFY